jgi:hypothetical protein
MDRFACILTAENDFASLSKRMEAVQVARRYQVIWLCVFTAIIIITLFDAFVYFSSRGWFGI